MALRQPLVLVNGNIEQLQAADTIPGGAPSGAAGGGLSGTYPNPDVAAATVAFATTGVLSPSSLGSDQNDYNPASLSTAAMLRLTASTAVNITGLQGGATGRILLVHNVGSSNITLKSQSSSSSAANRFALTGDEVLVPDRLVLLQYDATSSRWRCRGMANTGVTAGTYPKVTVGSDGRVTSGASTIAEGDIGLSDVTTDNASTSAHGFRAKLTNDATKIQDETGTVRVATQVNIYNVADSPVTFSVPSWAKVITIIAFGGGGQGGSGRKGLASSTRCGGGGGGSGAAALIQLPASAISSPVTITVGAGGSSLGAAQTGNSQNGNIGSAGGNSTFGTYVIAGGGNAGPAGTNSTTAGASAATTGTCSGAGGGAGTTGTGGSNGPANSIAGGGGGGGGPITSSSEVPVNGGIGGNCQIGYAQVGGSGLQGSAGTGSNSNGATDIASLPWGGGGGGGGASSTSTNGQDGGAGGKYGGGGGGGGAAVNSVGNSGRGGNGGDGVVFVFVD